MSIDFLLFEPLSTVHKYIFIQLNQGFGCKFTEAALLAASPVLWCPL
jgi:hypothetical protein